MTGQNQVCSLAPPTSELHTVNNLNTHTHYLLAQAPNWGLFPHGRQNKPVQVHPECSEQWQLSRDKQADSRTVCIFVSNWLHEVAKYSCFFLLVFLPLYLSNYDQANVTALAGYAMVSINKRLFAAIFIHTLLGRWFRCQTGWDWDVIRVY